MRALARKGINMNDIRQTIEVDLKMTSDQTGYLIKWIEFYLNAAVFENKSEDIKEKAFIQRINTKLKRAERKAYIELVK